jgi:hypothetical protein
MTDTNRQIQLASRPVGAVKPDNWAHVTVPTAAPADGEFAGRTRVISLDPAMRGWLDDRPSYIPPVGLGDVMRAASVVEVTSSQHPDYRPGDFVVGAFGVQEYVVSNGRGARKIDAAAASPATYLGALGAPGMTAYFGLLDVGALVEGETVVVSGAAGAVGTMVGQIAKVRGARVIGIAGGAAKCGLLTDELGFDAAIDYRAGGVRKALRAHAPDGIDVYFDNVGGEHLEAALNSAKLFARFAICGMISIYNATKPEPGPSNLAQLIGRNIRMEGFIVSHHFGMMPQYIADLSKWVAEGKVTWKETVVEGLDKAPDAFIGLFKGDNLGKMLVKLA